VRCDGTIHGKLGWPLRSSSATSPQSVGRSCGNLNVHCCHSDDMSQTTGAPMVDSGRYRGEIPGTDISSDMLLRHALPCKLLIELAT